MALFQRIVVGTDGSETAAAAVGQAIELAKLAGARLDVVSAYAPVPKRRLAAEQSGAPADVQHEIGPREDVNLVLEAPACASPQGTASNWTRPSKPCSRK